MTTNPFADLLQAAGVAASQQAALPLLFPREAPRLLPSSPHVLDIETFRRAFGGSPKRNTLIDALVARLREMTTAGARVDCVLVGGSFVDPLRDPNDLDGLMVYSMNDGAAFTRRLDKALVGNSDGLDLRYVASDAEPLLLVKMIAFFTALYTGFEDEKCLRRAAIVLRTDGIQHGGVEDE